MDMDIVYTGKGNRISKVSRPKDSIWYWALVLLLEERFQSKDIIRHKGRWWTVRSINTSSSISFWSNMLYGYQHQLLVIVVVFIFLYIVLFCSITGNWIPRIPWCWCVPDKQYGIYYKVNCLTCICCVLIVIQTILIYLLSPTRGNSK